MDRPPMDDLSFLCEWAHKHLPNGWSVTITNDRTKIIAPCGCEMEWAQVYDATDEAMGHPRFAEATEQLHRAFGHLIDADTKPPPPMW